MKGLRVPFLLSGGYSFRDLSKAKSMPVHFLKASGKGFFIDKEGFALALREELSDIIEKDAFRQQIKDILEYRTMEYYRRRYDKCPFK